MWYTRIRHIPVLLLVLILCDARGEEATRRELVYAPAPVDNPLKGLVPYVNPPDGLFPHSLEFNYLSLGMLVTGEKTYDWTPLEKLLTEISSHGNHAVVRVYLEFPGHKDSIPKYLLDGGLKVERYATKESPVNETPDYNDAKLRICLKDFIAALGKKYDGDPRIGFITAGLLGYWGEWHTYLRPELWASKEIQTEVLDAYEAAFKRTQVLLRYPAGEKAYDQAPNATRPFGYHDDSFAWGTLDTGKGNWFYMTMMKHSGSSALDKWKTHPIGGEIRPEAWGIVFDEKPELKEIQDFATCVKETHVTWLMDTGMFRKQSVTGERKKRAEEQVRKMGYEFYAPGVKFSVQNKTVSVALEVENRGVAPFYYEWPVEFALLDEKGSVAKTFSSHESITGLLPGDPARVWQEKLDAGDVAAGKYTIGVRVVNPLPNGKALRFANQEQGEVWLKLGSVSF